jgi:hypothetical protein
MVRKKLLTLVCVLGILACGACFLPAPPPVRRPPPPRVSTLDLRGIHAICVTVTNPSNPGKIDPIALGQWIADAINLQKGPDLPHAYGDPQATPGDAVLQVTVLEESVTSEPANRTQSLSRLEFQMVMGTTLTSPNGAVLWHEADERYHAASEPFDTAAIDALKDSRFAAWVQHRICNAFASHMLYDRR